MAVCCIPKLWQQVVDVIVPVTGPVYCATLDHSFPALHCCQAHAITGLLAWCLWERLEAW